MQFTKVAPFYDLLMKEIPYQRWLDYIEEICQKFNHRPKVVLDLACGTGSMSLLLAKQGYKVTGLDSSKEMLKEAIKKNKPRREFPRGINFIHSDMRNFSLEKIFNLIICLYDSLNYITKEEELEKVFLCVHHCLRKDGLFIFDVNSEYVLKNNFFNQDNLIKDEELKYKWISNFKEKNKISEIQMYFFYQKNNFFKCFKEIHYERAYSIEEIKNLLRKTNFKILALYHAFTLNPPDERTERIYFVTKINYL